MTSYIWQLQVENKHYSYYFDIFCCVYAVITLSQNKLKDSKIKGTYTHLSTMYDCTNFWAKLLKCRCRRANSIKSIINGTMFDFNLLLPHTISTIYNITITQKSFTKNACKYLNYCSWLQLHGGHYL